MARFRARLSGVVVLATAIAFVASSGWGLVAASHAGKPSYTDLDGASGGQEGRVLFLSVDTKGAIPRFPDAYVNSVPIFGYAWADLDTGVVIVAVIHPAIGRDSHQHPDAWHTHPVMVAAGTASSDFCIVSVGTSQAGIAIRGDTMRIVIPSHFAGVSASDLDVAASFEVHLDDGCASGLGVVLLHVAGL